MFLQYIKLAWNNLVRNWVQSLLSIGGLAVGLFCFSAFAYLVYSFLGVDRWYDNHDRVISLSYQKQEGPVIPFVGTVSDLVLTNESLTSIDEIECICSLTEVYETIFTSDDNSQVARNEEKWAIDSTFFQVFEPKLLAGNLDEILHIKGSILVSRHFATRTYGSVEAAMGQTIRSYSHAYTVRGVLEDLPPSNSIQPVQGVDLWFMKGENLSCSNQHKVYIMAKKGVSRQQLAERIDRNGIKFFWGEDGSKESCVYAHDLNQIDWNYLTAMVVLLLIVSFPGLLILLSSLSNFFHLLLSDIMMRQREYTLRRAHGAHTLDLWFMVSTYVTMMILLAGVLSMIVVESVSPLLNFRMGNIFFHIMTGVLIRQNCWHLIVLFLIGLLVAFLAVVRIRKRSLHESIKSSSGGRPGRHIGRNILLGYQLTLSMIFVSLLFAVLCQLDLNERAIYPQFSKEERKDILCVTLRTQDALDINRLEAIQNVKSVIDITQLDFDNMSQYYNTCDMLTENGDSIKAVYNKMRTDVLKFLRVELEEGRFAESPMEVVADVALMEKFHLKIGDQITYLQKVYNPDGNKVNCYTYTITGTVESPRLKLLGNGNGNNVQNARWSTAGIYAQQGIPFSSTWTNVMIECEKDKAQAVRDSLEVIADGDYYFLDSEGNRIITEQKLKIHSLEEICNSTNEGFKVLRTFFLTLSAIALFLSLAGIYAAIAVDTKHRRKEMAIRKINGAKTRQIVMLFARFYLIEMSVAALIAFPITGSLVDWFTVENYREAFTTNVFFFVVVFLFIALFVTLTVGYQIWKIAMVKPAEIIKSE